MERSPIGLKWENCVQYHGAEREIRVRTLSEIVLTLLLMAILAPTPHTLGTEQGDSSETEWTRTYGGANDDRAYCVVQTSDDGYAIAEYSTRSAPAVTISGWLRLAL